MTISNAVRRICKTSAAVTLLTFSGLTVNSLHSENPYSVSVDTHGRMRRSDTGAEVRYYGTNYTLPFAHAYRAIDRQGIDHRSAIDRDVYHLSRMGINAFRLHLWDAELADSVGQLLDNDHLELLDYLIASLEERGISVILTAQTNFGNGYPERDTDTGAFTYDYAKCEIHENPEAIKAQKRYIDGLVRHVNPFTGRSYASDRSIIALEINNEPCHQSDARQVKDYINTMVKALRKAGWKKPVLYNVSHNMPVVEGYYAADIQGTTYQWYPIGLVAGHERKGNFLPYVDSYDIPFSGVKGFGSKAKVVYEFDPADMLDSYMFPAVARTFASEGFQWATQFAYDPIDIARFNTEYQTHYLNLAYTPQKALGMKIAAKAMERTPSGVKYSYPADTVFGDFTVSYRRNLAQLNSPREFYYTNNTDATPVAPDSLREVAGYGSSPVVEYAGLGAYLLDKVNDGVWRLEVLPDMLYSADPFGKPSEKRAVAHAVNSTHPMTVRLPGLGSNFRYQGINASNPFGGTASDSTFPVIPGVYLLAADSAAMAQVDPAMQFGAIRLNEYVAPPAGEFPVQVVHKNAPIHFRDSDLTVTVKAFGNPMPDSLVLYPADASFWRHDNDIRVMKRVAPYTYQAVIPADRFKGKDEYGYRIVAYADSAAVTYPGAVEGTPLDWDAPEPTPSYVTRILDVGAPVTLLSGADGTDGLELSTIPDSWGRVRLAKALHAPFGTDAVKVSATEGDEPVRTVITRYVKDIVSAIPAGAAPTALEVGVGESKGYDKVTVSVVNSDGITYSSDIPLRQGSVAEVRLADMKVSPTLLCPAPYPVFLSREFVPEGYDRPLRWEEIEKVQLVFPAYTPDSKTAEITGITLR